MGATQQHQHDQHGQTELLQVGYLRQVIFWLINMARFSLISLNLIRWEGALSRYRNCIERLVGRLRPHDGWHLQILGFLLLEKIKLWRQEKVGVGMANLPASGQGGAKGRGGKGGHPAWTFGKRVASQMAEPDLSIYHWDWSSHLPSWEKPGKSGKPRLPTAGGQGPKSAMVRFSGWILRKTFRAFSSLPLFFRTFPVTLYFFGPFQSLFYFWGPFPGILLLDETLENGSS